MLFVPNMHRFFGGVLHAEFPKAQADVQRDLPFVDGHVLRDRAASEAARSAVITRLRNSSASRSSVSDPRRPS